MTALRFGLCLHGGAVGRSSLRLHEADRRALAVALAAGAEVVVIEVVGQRGTAPLAAGEALAAGAARAVRLVDAALDTADARATGFVLATVLDYLKVDLVLFGDDADPEGAGDVPACVAHHMSAVYLDEATNIITDGADAAVDITTVSGGWLRRLRVPLNAVVGITAAPAALARATPVRPATSSDEVGAPKTVVPPVHGTIDIMSLADLNVDPAAVRGRHDRRGVIDIAPRPLVTLQSPAAVAALLKR